MTVRGILVGIVRFCVPGIYRSSGAELTVKLNAHVDRWADSMKAKLRARAAWGEGWLEDGDKLPHLLNFLHEEMVEFERAVSSGASAEYVREAAADVSNLANMVADVHIKRKKEADGD